MVAKHWEANWTPGAIPPGRRLEVGVSVLTGPGRRAGSAGHSEEGFDPMGHEAEEQLP
ncbi:MAG: hypothetical protein QME94_03385 [Anaerolineae bacterium]|nr:hypothetical protein [Anaerolineae bacterium]